MFPALEPQQIESLVVSHRVEREKNIYQSAFTTTPHPPPSPSACPAILKQRQGDKLRKYVNPDRAHHHAEFQPFHFQQIRENASIKV